MVLYVKISKVAKYIVASCVQNFGLSHIILTDLDDKSAFERMGKTQEKWLVVLGFNATLTAKVILWRLVMHMCFLVFLTPVLTQLFFSKPPTTFLTWFCRSERRKCAGKKVRLNRDRTHNQQVVSPTRSPLSHPGKAVKEKEESMVYFVSFNHGVSVGLFKRLIFLWDRLVTRSPSDEN